MASRTLQDCLLACIAGYTRPEESNTLVGLSRCLKFIPWSKAYHSPDVPEKKKRFALSTRPSRPGHENNSQLLVVSHCFGCTCEDDLPLLLFSLSTQLDTISDGAQRLYYIGQREDTNRRILFGKHINEAKLEGVTRK